MMLELKQYFLWLSRRLPKIPTEALKGALAWPGIVHNELALIIAKGEWLGPILIMSGLSFGISIFVGIGIEKMHHNEPLAIVVSLCIFGICMAFLITVIIRASWKAFKYDQEKCVDVLKR